MKSKNKFKKIKNCICYYFINFSIILLNEKIYENILVYNISHKSPTSTNPLHIKFDKIDGFITSLDGKI